MKYDIFWHDGCIHKQKKALHYISINMDKNTTTVLIELTNKKAIRLLHELEELQLIKVLKENVEPVKTKLSDKYKGFMTKEEGQQLSEHINQMRNEWNSI